MPEAWVADLLRAAAEGAFPPADAGWTMAAPWRDGVGAVIAFTGHAVIVPPSRQRPTLHGRPNTLTSP